MQKRRFFIKNRCFLRLAQGLLKSKQPVVRNFGEKR
jgi:hypothetical protein